VRRFWLLLKHSVSDSSSSSTELVAVLDMGASAVRLVVAEILADRSIRTIEEASRGILLGRDSFSTGVIQAKTIAAVGSALDNFRHIMDSYGTTRVRAVATSAVREAKNADLFLDQVQRRTGIAFDIINEAEESRLVLLAAKQLLGRRAEFQSSWTLLTEVGGGGTSLMLLKHGEPNRSAVYALGAVRLRQALGLRRLSHDVQLALLKRSITNVIEEIRREIPLQRVTHIVALGGDVRFAAARILDTLNVKDHHAGSDDLREIPRDAFLEFCGKIERLTEEQLIERFRLPAVDAETLLPSLLVYGTLLSETTAQQVVVSDASLRTGLLLDLAEPGGRLKADDFERQVLASADALGHKHRFDRAHGQHVAALATQLFDQLLGDHGLGDRERLLLRVASLLHDIGIYVSLRAHHKHSQYLIAASQIFGLTDDETAIVANIARYHRRALPQRSHLQYVALDRRDRVTVNKLAAILRIANALDAEHLQKVRSVKLVRGIGGWSLEVEGEGDLTMEQLAATARSDMFEETYVHELAIRIVSEQP
jgi:exopolyphosphatase/guanosine-5'-triphosphate,3'-diphosphate pyrophosphatase